MRILLVPRQLARELPGHDVRTVVQQKWAGVKNGELLRRAGSDGFEAFITADQNLEYQQNLARSGLGILIVKAPTNKLRDLQPPVPSILKALSSMRPGTVMRVSS